MAPVTDAEALGIAIDAERVASKLTREELAELAGVSVESLGRYLRGETEPSLARLRGLANALDQRPRDLLTRADQVMGRIARREAGAQAAVGDKNVQIGGDMATAAEGDADADDQSVAIGASTFFGDVNIVVPDKPAEMDGDE